MIKKTFFLLVCLCGCAMLWSQPRQEIVQYLHHTGSEALLYRGERAPLYKKGIEGTFYESCEDFYKGDLWYNNHYYPGVLLNLNSHLNLLYVKDSVYAKSIVLKSNLVDSAKFGGYRYIYSDSLSVLPKGKFFKVLYQGSNLSVYKWTKKTYREKIDQNYSSLNKGVTKLFEEEVSYYIVDKDGAQQLRRKSQLFKKYRELNSQARRFARDRALDFKAEPDASYAELVQFIDGRITRIDGRIAR